LHSPAHTDCLFEAKPIHLQDANEAFIDPEKAGLSSDNLYNARLVSTVSNEQIDLLKDEEEEPKLMVTNSKSSSSLASLILIQSSPATTTIAQAIEETEALIALRQKQMPFSYLYNAMNADSDRNAVSNDLNYVHSVSTSAFSLMRATLGQSNMPPTEALNEYDNELNMKPTLIEIPNLCLSDSSSSSANSTLSTKSSLVSYKLTPNACSSPLESANRISNSIRVRSVYQEVLA
jgi:hypothetical protein